MDSLVELSYQRNSRTESTSWIN